MSNWPQISLDLPADYGGCFGCGRENPIGLRLKFEPHENGVRTVFTPDERYQGWPGYMHGGILGCMLDEAMSWAAVTAGIRCITAEYDVKLKRLTPINVPLTVTGAITKKTRKVVHSVSSVTLPDGTVVAEGSATQFVVGTGGWVTDGR